VNIKKRKRELHRHTSEMLRLWLVDNDKEGTLKYYNTIDEQAKPWILGAIKDVIGSSESMEFVQASVDIPKYILTHNI